MNLLRNYAIRLFAAAILGMAWPAPHAPARAASGESEPIAEASEPAPLPTIELNEFVVLPAVGQYGRLPMHRDAVELQLVTGVWQSPTAGDRVMVPGAPPKTWRAATAENGTLETRIIRGGYAFTKFNSPVEHVMLLEAAGHASVYVNGELRVGDPYSLGWLRLPVLVREGENTLLFHVAAERLSARLVTPPADVFFLDADRTLPTIERGNSEFAWGAIPIVNASREWIRDAQFDSGGVVETVPPIPPLTIVKSPFQIAPNAAALGAVPYRVKLLAATTGEPLATAEFSIRVVGPEDVQVRTFRSRIDGSVQPYAVRRASAPTPAAATDETDLPGTIFTLHGAAVDCAAEAAQHEPQNWAHVIAPQGRGIYGFDWEDWGRIDFLEALADADRHFPTNPLRTYLTGQSMGGHGTWHLGVTYPDLFAAIGPAGAWASFWSYGGGMPTFESPTPLESLLLRSYNPSDTIQLLANLADVGVYVLHDGDDQSVPVAQARFMRSRLAGFHPNFAYYEEPEGNSTLASSERDWQPMLQFFERLERPLPEDRTTVDFATANPGVSSHCDWLAIEAQQTPLSISRAVVRQDADTRTFVGQTTNVLRLAIDVAHLPPGQPIDVALDGQQIQWIPWPENTQRLWFTRRENQWESTGPPSPRLKTPERCGPFKAAFDHEAILVYGTGGTEEEDRWAEAKARYDAETFWYRGNGRFEVQPDHDFDPGATIGRNVVLYGNADTNSAWSRLLADCPVQVRRGEVRVGDRSEAGDDLAVLMIYPRADSDAASVGVVAGTGPVGMAITNRLRYFVSGIAYPDLMIADADSLLDGVSAIRAWGYFGHEWKVEDGDIVWAAQ